MLALALEASANGDYKVTHHDSNGNATKLKGQDVTILKAKSTHQYKFMMQSKK